MPVMLVIKEYFIHDFCFLDSAHHLYLKKQAVSETGYHPCLKRKCVGNASELHRTERAILNHWTKHYVFFEYETM